ncbi:Gfo/Idh/MocA family protein [Arenivirga flava]|nr:Gfo/Idh/MocA family oxidoreductase [Arenivirga flava]
MSVTVRRFEGERDMVEQHPPIRTALVGCGVIGRTHAQVLAALPGYRLVAAIDRDADGASAIADLVAAQGDPRPRTAASLAEALAEGEPFELVVVATPSGLHVQLALEALDADRHVLVEKPLDVDLPRARALADAAREAADRGVLASVVSQHRLDPSTVALAAAIEQGRLGRITSAVASVPWWRGDDYYAAADWRGTWAMDGGGALMNQGVHTLDLLLALLGRPAQVTAEFARTAHEGIEVEDTLVGTIAFESGALAAVHATTAGYPGLGARLQVQGSAGSAVVEDDVLVSLHLADLENGADPRNAHASMLAQPDPAEALGLGWAGGHARQYLDLQAALHGRSRPAVPVEDAALVLATVRALYVSATLGRRIAVDAVLGGEHDEVVAAPTGTAALRR